MKKLSTVFLSFVFSLMLSAVALASPSVINVQTAAELVAAIGSDRIINLAPGTYNLTDVANSVKTPFVSWSEEHDGSQLNIENVKNLKIMGGVNASDYHIVVSPAYADVFEFNDCENISLSGLKMGHLKTGGCVGSVVHFRSSKGINIDNCDLYGCGVIGLEMAFCENVKVTRSSLRDCSMNSLSMNNCNDVLFESNQFKEGKDSWGAGVFLEGKIEKVTFKNNSFAGYSTEKNVFGCYLAQLREFKISDASFILLGSDNRPLFTNPFSYDSSVSGSKGEGLFNIGYNAKEVHIY